MDDSDMWKGYREQSKEKRWSNFRSTLKILEEKGIEYKILNAGIGHLRIGDFDFWPTTGKYYNQKTGISGRGIFNLIAKIKTI